MKPTQEKHLPYFVVLDALKESAGCFLCTLEEKALRRYMDSLLYESVNDPGIRADLKASHGFCHHHAHLMAATGNAFCAALLYQDHVISFTSLLGDYAKENGKHHSPDQIVTWASHASCPACRIQAADRDRHVTTLLDNLDEEDMRTAFESSAPLCIPHLGVAFRKAREKGYEQRLISVQYEPWARLSGELNEFIRKHDYRFSSEPMGKAGDSWKRAVSTIVGNERIF